MEVVERSDPCEHSVTCKREQGALPLFIGLCQLITEGSKMP